MIESISVIKGNIHEVSLKVQLFLEANPHIVTTHDYDCGFNGKFDTYIHNPAHSCRCAVESDGICRIRMKRVNGSTDICIITVGMAVVITDSYIAIKEKTNICNYKFLYHLIYPDYAYRIAPNNAYNPESEWSYTIARNLPSGLRDIIEASNTYHNMKCAPDSTEKMLQSMKIHNLKYDNPTAAAYIMLFGLSRSKFGLISRFARYACYITEQEDHSRKFLHESSIITNTWCNMMYDWLERVNSPLVDPSKGFFTIHKGNKMIVVSEQDVYNFLALITLSTDDSFFDNYVVGGRYKLYYTHTDLSTHTIRVMHETYQSPGENRLAAIDYGPLDTRGSMNIE